MSGGEDVPRVVTDALYVKLMELYRLCEDLYGGPGIITFGGTERFEHVVKLADQIKRLLPEIDELLAADKDYWTSFVSEGEGDEPGQTPPPAADPQ